ncbi:MAG: ABC transporter ATP-binding protein [Sphaerochaetaceae bacterium]|jgi:lipoprotein-releasing system ATP-binding protein
MHEPLLRFENVVKKYPSGTQELLILENLNLTLESRRSIAIVGKSGSGKSTLLNLAGGLAKPTAGRVLFQGKDLGKMHDRELSYYRNRHVGFVFQSHILLEDFSALENICIPALIKGGRLKEVKKRALELLERVGLADRVDHRPQKLSGGERQRVALCRALINQCDLIIADEPTGSLDEGSKGEIEDLLLQLVVEAEKSLLLVTHEKSLALRCDTVYQLENRGLTLV